MREREHLTLDKSEIMANILPHMQRLRRRDSAASIQTYNPLRFSQPNHIAQSGAQTAGVGDALPGDIKGGAVGRGGAYHRQAHPQGGDIAARLQFAGDVHLIVVHADDAIKIAIQRSLEGRCRPARDR